MNAPKEKFALCIDATAAPEEYRSMQGYGVVPIPRNFYDAPTRLISRNICEKDESTLQVIPYIVLANTKGEFFCYSRGKGGNEEKLHGNLSIGLGGHIDGEVPEGWNLHRWISDEAARELHEETNLKRRGQFGFTHLIKDAMEPVGRVHLGVLTIYRLYGDEALTLEQGVIEDGSFVSLSSLLEPSVYSRLENWSKAVVDYLVSE